MEYLTSDAKQQLLESSENVDQGTEDDGQPPSKKRKGKRFKLIGKNQNRRKHNRLNFASRLCPTIVNDTHCSYGDKCRFLHDVDKYFETKPNDLGISCYVFEQTGYCRFGVTCRFASSHLTDKKENVVNDELLCKSKNDFQYRYDFNKGLQVALRQKRHCFPRSEIFFKAENIVPQFETKVTSKTMITSTSQNVSAQADCVTANVQSNAGCIDSGDVKLDVNHSSRAGALTDEDVIRLRPNEKKTIDFSNKLYLAPLTTVGNLPFRRVCKEYGVDITCGEMAMATNLLQGQQSEWALLKRHSSEDIFGAQLCGSHVDSMTRCAELIQSKVCLDFVDINCGCPIDLVFNKGAGSALMTRMSRFRQIIKGMTSVMDIPLTVKLRTGVKENDNTAHDLIPMLRDSGISLITMHGRSRQQRYTRSADWDYIDTCAKLANPVPFFGNGDILSYEELNSRLLNTDVAGCMIARGALIKPWIFTELKEQRHWDISSSERFEMLRRFTNYGLMHWGSDDQGVNSTRRFLLEWLSFLHRYVPVGILEQVPQRINERPPYYIGRDDLETLFASANCGDWVKISEMFLGPVPDDFTFLPKHKANAYK
ncbi:tRNA-dihydrouridine(47) synthase [NAD(P)(+)]-like isoform X2 [Tubulanus polymorphus]